VTVRRLAAGTLVVGGGPSGSVLAGLLARRGRDVLVVDRAPFPRAKACGECLNPGGVEALERLGLLEPVLATGPIGLEGWDLHTPAGVRVRATFPANRRALGVRRSSFDHALLRTARERGARILEGVRIRSVDPGDGRRFARADGVGPDGGAVSIRADVLVGADGLRSVVARSAGTVRRRPRLRKASLTWRIRGSGPSRERGRLLLGGDWTVGLAPVPPDGEGTGDPRWNATLVVDPVRFRTELSSDPWPLLVRGLRLMDLRWASGPAAVRGPWASGPFDWPSRAAVVGRTLLTGDAAGYYDPLTGQGLFRALRSAELSAEAIVSALQESGRGGAKSPAPLDERRLEHYDARLRSELGPGRMLQRLIEGVLSRPYLREPALRLLARHARAATSVIELTGDLRTSPRSPPEAGTASPAPWLARGAERFHGAKGS
jgi:menaquinone-9 beta-reductase